MLMALSLNPYNFPTGQGHSRERKSTAFSPEHSHSRAFSSALTHSELSVFTILYNKYSDAIP